MQTIILLRDGVSTGPQRVDGFPCPPASLHTINALSNGWVGTIRLLASIEVEPDSDSWFVLSEREVSALPRAPHNVIWNEEGCLVWLKVELIPSVNTRGRVDRIIVI